MQSRNLPGIVKIRALRGSTVLLAAVSLIVLGTALVLAQSTAAKSDTKATVYATDQNLAQAAAATAVSSGTAYVNALSSKPTTCSSGSGCAGVYSGTALSGGATSQSETWWTTSGNTHTATCSGLSAAGDLKCVYVVEQASCDTSTGNIDYTVTGYGYFSSTGSTYSKNITTAKSTATVTRTAFATAGGSTSATFMNPTTQCPVYYSNYASYDPWGQVYFNFSQAVTTPNLTLNSSQPGSTYTNGTGSITTVGIATRGSIFGSGNCSEGVRPDEMTITLYNNTQSTSSSVVVTNTNSNENCVIGSGVGNTYYAGPSIKTFTLSTPVSVNYGDVVHVQLTNVTGNAYSRCFKGTSTYNGSSTTSVGGGGARTTSNTSDMNNLIYSLSGTVSTYTCP